MKIANLICIFFAIFSLSAVDVSKELERLEPKKHVSFENEGKRVDNFLSVTFSKLQKACANMQFHYNEAKYAAKKESKKAVKKAVDKAKDTAKDAAGSAVDSVGRKVSEAKDDFFD